MLRVQTFNVIFDLSELKVTNLHNSKTAFTKIKNATLQFLNKEIKIITKLTRQKTAEHFKDLTNN